MYAIWGSLFILAVAAIRDEEPSEPRTKTGSLAGSGGIEKDLAYRLFAGIEMNFEECFLNDRLHGVPSWTYLDSLPSTKWYDVSKQDSWLYWPESSSSYECTFVPGKAFDFRGSVTRSYLLGFCFREPQAGLNDPHCFCGYALDFGNPGDPPGEMARFTGCKEWKEPPEAFESAANLSFGNDLTVHAKWEHPATLWVKAQQDKWCSMALQKEPKLCNSVRHALPYCIVADYTLRHDTDKERANDVVHFLAWAANYDQEHPTRWFAASRSRLKIAWRNLKRHFQTVPVLPPRLEDVLKDWSDLCALIHASAPMAWALINRTNEAYMERVSGKQPAVNSDGPPIFVFAAGPPSSGKSITSMTRQDFDIIVNKTNAFGSRTYENFQSNTVELNVDRIVESTDLVAVSKEHMSTRSRWIEALQDTKKSKEMADLQQETGQLEYRLVRFTSGVDDLSNANTQRILAMKQDCIYETVLGDKFVDWAIQFELPKIAKAGHRTVLINYQVPVPVLVQRAFDREKKTGQTPAPAAQIENDAKAAPANFMNPRLLDWIDHAVSMSHVRKGQTEDVFAVFNRGKGKCFDFCAEDTPELEKYDVSMPRRCSFAMC